MRPSNRQRSGRQQAALKVHSSMMRDLAGLRWQSQRRRRRPSGQRRPSTKPSRGRAWVTHTAPKQPSLPSAEDGRAAWGPPAAAAARTMPMLRNAFQPNVTLLCTYTVRMSRMSDVVASCSSLLPIGGSAVASTHMESHPTTPWSYPSCEDVRAYSCKRPSNTCFCIHM